MPPRIIIAGIIAVLFLWIVGQSFTIVEAGHVGVVKTLGAVQPTELGEGFHFVKPLLDRVEAIDVRLRKASNEAGAASRDLQVVRTRVAVQYSMNGPVTPLAYQKIGNRAVLEATLVNPAILESVKAVTAQYTAEELVTKRAEVKNRIQEAIELFINTTLEQKGAVGALSLANVAITDFDFSPEFNKAIEEKVQAEQEALQAKNEKLKRVTQAEAAAAERTLAADAEAYQIQVASKARAEAIRREAEALRGNPALIQLRVAEKWNGVLPQVSGGGTVPLLNLDGLGGKK